MVDPGFAILLDYISVLSFIIQQYFSINPDVTVL